MFRCPFDGYRVVEIGDGLYKCMYCNNYLREKDGVLVPYAMKAYPYDRDVRESLVVKGLGRRARPESAKTSRGEGIPFRGGLSQDMVIFIGRVANALIPLEGYNQETRLKLLNTQNKIKRDLTRVFEGKRDFQKWYDQTRTNFSKRNIEMMQILYDAAEGLESQEAKELRNAYARAMDRGPFG